MKREIDASKASPTISSEHHHAARKLGRLNESRDPAVEWDLHFMRRALALAQEAAEADEIPVGALVVHHPADARAEPRVIGEGFNQRQRDHDPTSHAEIVAMRRAGTALRQWRLLDCTLYVTLEPCPMCAGAMVNARLPRLVYGCADPKAGAIATLYQICSDPRLNHRLEVVAGVMADEAGALLKQFFAARRSGRLK